MSFDNRPLAAARRHGIRAIKPDESWLLDPEPSPADRRVAELEQRVKLLQTTDPELRVAIRMLSEPPFIRYRIPPLSPELIEPAVRMILSKHPRERVGDGMLAFRLNENSDYDEEYDRYAAELRSIDVPNLHLGVARQFSQYGVEVTVENAGALTAEHVTVEIRSGNARLHAAPFLAHLFGPAPPSTERDPYGHISGLTAQLAKPDRASFGLNESEDPSVQVEYRCEDFRHGRTQLLSAVIEPTECTRDAAHLEVRVTAGNMRGQVAERLIIPVAEQERPLGELVDLDHLVLRLSPVITEQLSSLVKGE